VAYLDAGALTDPLVLRPRRRGDRFRPQGMEGHHVRLSDFMINQHVPRAWRDRVPLFTTGDEIAWVCGLRVGQGSTVGAETRRVVRLWFECI
jgi:tRNA(Ile)-lysidine synthase